MELLTCHECGKTTDRIYARTGKKLCEECNSKYTYCHLCGKWSKGCDEDHHCPDCQEKYSQCDCCGEWVNNDTFETVRSNHRDEEVCPMCKENHYRKCYGCDDYYYVDDLTNIQGHDYCDECRDEQFFECEGCGEWHHVDDQADYEDSNYCQACYDERFTECCECGETIRRDYATCRNGSWYCEECAPERSIHDYGYKPSPEFFGTGPLYLGIELEVECSDDDPESVAENIRGNYLHVYCKHDGSLSNGVEIVSHPMGRDWKIEEEYTKMLKDLREAGCRSYNTDSCGIHIHTSKNAWTTLQLYKLLKFIYENPVFVLKVSQRKENNLRQWASVWDGKSNGESICYKAKNKHGNYSRRTAINLQPNHTIEFRIFRGTLNPQSFMKNVQFVLSLYDYTNEVGIKEVSVESYLKFLQNNAIKYKHMYNFMAKGQNWEAI